MRDVSAYSSFNLIDMKILIVLIITLIVSITSLEAQENSNHIRNGFGIGFQLNQYQHDFGLGLNITSPLFLNDIIGVRLRANLMFNENVQDLSNSVWSAYSNLTLGLIGMSGMVGTSVRLYGEGGIIGILPSDEFSSESFVPGGYGLFGFEFFMSSFNNYFIEIGAVGTGAREDKNLTQPIYSNGLLISTGFRFYLN